MSLDVVMVNRHCYEGVEVGELYAADICGISPDRVATVRTEDGMVDIDEGDYEIVSSGEVFKHLIERNRTLEDRISDLERQIEHIVDNVDLPTLI